MNKQRNLSKWLNAKPWRRQGPWCRLPLGGLVILAAALVACGGGSGGGGGGSGLVDITGSIRGQTSDVTDNAGWSVVFSDQRTGVCKVGTVGAAGQYEVFQVNAGQPHTVVLLDGNFRLQSVLSFPGLETGQIRQFFTFAGNTLPTLIHEGGIVRFADTSNLTLNDSFANDISGTAGDGVPDGMDQTPVSTANSRSRLQGSALSAEVRDYLALQANADQVPDNDGDEVANTEDPDIDGDGIINRFDVDADGDTNGVQNIFSADADGSLEADILETTTESHFSEGIEYFVAQVVQEMDSATTFQTYLNFTVKLRDTSASFVTIHGSEALLSDAAAVTVDQATGVETEAVWDLTLLDDGLNGDSDAKDQIYSRKVLLGTDVVPLPGEVVFARLQYGKVAADAKFTDFPFIFPDMTTNPFTPTVTDTTFTLNLADNPFLVSGATEGARQFKWSIHIYDETVEPRRKVFNSDPKSVADLAAGASTTYTVPSNAIPSGSYVAYVVLQALGVRLPGLGQWSLISLPINVTIP